MRAKFSWYLLCGASATSTTSSAGFDGYQLTGMLPAAETVDLSRWATRSLTVPGTVSGDAEVVVAGMNISEFAQVAGLTAKALRLYDRLELLTPTEVHPRSGYRCYDASQLERARLAAGSGRHRRPETTGRVPYRPSIQ